MRYVLVAFILVLALYATRCGEQEMLTEGEKVAVVLEPTIQTETPAGESPQVDSEMPSQPEAPGEAEVPSDTEMPPKDPAMGEPEVLEPLGGILTAGKDIKAFEYRAVTDMVLGRLGAADVKFDLASGKLTGKIVAAYKHICTISHQLSSAQIQNIRDKFDRFYYKADSVLHCAPPVPQPSVFMHVNNQADYIFLTQSTCGFYGKNYYRVLEDQKKLIAYIKDLFNHAASVTPECDKM